MPQPIEGFGSSLASALAMVAWVHAGVSLGAQLLMNRGMDGHRSQAQGVGSWCQAPGVRHLGSWCQTPGVKAQGVRHLVQGVGSWCQAPGVRHLTSRRRCPRRQRHETPPSHDA